MDMVAYVIEKYNGKQKRVTYMYDRKIFSSYKYQSVGHKSSGFDEYIVLNSLPERYTNTKTKNIEGVIKNEL